VRPHPDGPSEQGPSAGTAGIQRVRLVQTFRAARVVGDPDVAEAVVEGPHVAEREGDVLVVHGDDVPGAHGFVFSRGDRPWYPRGRSGPGAILVVPGRTSTGGPARGAALPAGRAAGACSTPSAAAARS
jgi:hypothetical protein